MLSPGRRWAQRITILVLTVVSIFLLLPWLTSALRAGISITLAGVYLLAYLFAIIALPLILFSLLKFAYSVFLRPYLPTCGSEMKTTQELPRGCQSRSWLFVALRAY